MVNPDGSTIDYTYDMSRNLVRSHVQCTVTHMKSVFKMNEEDCRVAIPIHKKEGLAVLDNDLITLAYSEIGLAVSG